MSALYEVRFTISADKDYEFLQENNIKLFDKVNEIYGRSFYNCRYLTEANFLNVRKIHESAFEDARNLQKISLPKIESISHEAFEFDDSINWVGIDASRNPEAEGMDIQQIFGEHNNSTNGKLHNIGSNGTYKDQWLNKLCGNGDHHG
jgi:hypothetical protein